MKSKGFTLFLGIFLFWGLQFTGGNQAIGAETFELKFASHIPLQSSTHQVFDLWAKEVEKRTGGRVKTTFYPAASLVKPQDSYPSTAKGICDVAFQVLVNDASRFPLNSVVDIPMMGWRDDKAASAIRRELFWKFPALQAEFKDVKVLWQVASNARNMHFVDKEVRVPEDMKGMKIIASGVSAKAMKDMGASPIVLLPPDWYTSLERGIVKGACSGWTTIYNHKVHTLMPFHLDMNLAYLGQGAIMNMDTWKKLPKDIQKIIDDLEPWVVEKMIESENAEALVSMDAARKLGHKLTALSDQELKKWYDGARPVQELWLTENKKKGLPAQEVFDEAKRLIEKYGK